MNALLKRMHLKTRRLRSVISILAMHSYLKKEMVIIFIRQVNLLLIMIVLSWKVIILLLLLVIFTIGRECMPGFVGVILC